MHSRYNDPELLNTIYNSEYVITLDELPADLYSKSVNTVVKKRYTVYKKSEQPRTLLILNNSSSKQIPDRRDFFSLSGRRADMKSRKILNKGIYIKKK